MNKEKRNFVSLVIGSIIILVGLLSFSITFSKQIYLGIIISLLALVAGSILAILGGFRKWQ